MEMALTRTSPPGTDHAEAPAAQGGIRSDAQLLVGTLYDDALLVRALLPPTELRLPEERCRVS